MHPVNLNPSTAELHKFGWAMVLGFGVVGAILWYVTPDPNSLPWVANTGQKTALAVWLLGPVLLLISHAPRSVARPVYVVWMTGAMYMGTVMGFLGLSVMFVVLLPVFSLIRFADPLRLKLRPAGESYWEDHRHHESTLERTIRPF